MPFDNQAVTGTRNNAGFFMHVDALDLAKSELGLMQVLYHNAEQVTLTGTTAETPLRDIPLPGGLLGRNGMLIVTPIWSYTAGGSSKWLRLRLGGTLLAIVDNQSSATSQTSQAQFMISNRNSESSQICAPIGSNGLQIIVSNAPNYSAIDTSVTQTLSISGMLQSSLDTFKLERVLVEVLPT